MAHYTDDFDSSTGIPVDLPQFQDSAAEHFDETSEIVPWVLEFRVIDTPEIIHAPVTENLLIGRRDEERGILPAIELSSFGARKKGVSRQHAQIRARDNRITIEDLGSANGTAVNGQMIAPKQPFRLREGDVIRLGSLQLQIHFLVKPQSDDETIEGLEDGFIVPKIANGERLLILDDNRDICHVLRYIGIQAGFQVRVAYTLMDAINALENEQIDLILLELMLPDGNGLDVVKYTRHKISASLPIVASSVSNYRAQQALELGANVFISKPISIKDLMRHLGTFIH